MVETTLTIDELNTTQSTLVTPDTTRGAQFRFETGRQYVLDGNRVRADHDGRTWWLETVDSGLWLRVTCDGRFWAYWRDRCGRFALYAEVEDSWEMFRPLDEALKACSRFGHAWSPEQRYPFIGEPHFVWRWCVTCGAESVVTAEGVELMWPEDAEAVTFVTGGFLPMLHGVDPDVDRHLLTTEEYL
jgi:hypothetical protein